MSEKFNGEDINLDVENVEDASITTELDDEDMAEYSLRERPDSHIQYFDEKTYRLTDNGYREYSEKNYWELQYVSLALVGYPPTAQMLSLSGEFYTQDQASLIEVEDKLNFAIQKGSIEILEVEDSNKNLVKCLEPHVAVEWALSHKIVRREISTQWIDVFEISKNESLKPKSKGKKATKRSKAKITREERQEANRKEAEKYRKVIKEELELYLAENNLDKIKKPDFYDKFLNGFVRSKYGFGGLEGQYEKMLWDDEVPPLKRLNGRPKKK